ncbi:MAG: DUF2628 domain-containing protein [Proteobacteria bacterium]|nr:DUF2628 domain-containing protein [Pseudomonadota bacterium]
MARYTVHVPKLAPSHEAALERAVFVREGWSWGAFFFGPLWLLWHRHWVIGLIVLVLEGVLLGTLDSLSLHPTASAMAHFLLSLLFGLEGASLRRFALAKAGYAEVALVAGGSMDEMERRFFASVTPVVPAVAAPVSVVPQVSPGGVIGLFPQART